MDYSELLAKRRAVRDFEDKEVPLDAVIQIINESCLAPSSSNGQPWRFIIVNNKEVMKRLSDDSKRNLLQEIERNPNPTNSRYEPMLRDEKFNVYYNAPCLVFIVGSNNLRTLDVDCGLVAAYFMFSATAKGLATCWIGLGRHIKDPALRNLIGLPDSDRIVAPVIIGYPKQIPSVPDRKGPEILKIVP